MNITTGPTPYKWHSECISHVTSPQSLKKTILDDVKKEREPTALVDLESLAEECNLSSTYLLSQARERDQRIQKVFDRSRRVPGYSACRGLSYVDVDARLITPNVPEFEQRFNRDCQRLGIEGNYWSVHRNFRRGVWSFEQYMDKALYGPQGYYSSGRVQFGSAVSKGDFVTAPSGGPCLGMQLADQAFTIWKRMVEAGDLRKDEKFDVVELGAGNGDLANQFIDHVIYKSNYFADSDPAAVQFAKVLKYTIIEISEKLRDRQASTNSKHLRKGFVQIVEGDARNLSKSFPKDAFNGMVISNEVPDAFPVHRCVISEDNEITVETATPLISQEWYLSDLDFRTQRELKRASDYYKDYFRELYDSKDVENNYLVISVNDLDKIKPEYLPHIVWKRVYLPMRPFFPEIEEFLIENPKILEKVKPGEPFNLNLHAPKFIQGIEAILKKGFVITIDYGDPNSHLENSEFRFFGPSKKRPGFVPPTQDFHNSFSEIDLTASVNFMVLADAGKALKPMALIAQNDLSRIQPELDNAVYNTVRQFRDEFPNYNETFYALVQQKQGTQALYGIPANSSRMTGLDVLKHKIVQHHLLYPDLINRVNLYASALIKCKKHFNEAILKKDHGKFESYFASLFDERMVPNKDLSLALWHGIKRINERKVYHEAKSHYAKLSGTERSLVDQTLEAYKRQISLQSFEPAQRAPTN